MLHATRMMVTALAVGLLGLSVAHAQPNVTPRKVQDDLNWFSKDAREKANADIARIKRDFHKDLVIETIKAPERPKDLNPKDEKAVSKFFDEWAMSRFRNEQVDGVMVLLVDQPKILRVEVGRNTERLFFPGGNADELRRKITEHLKKDDKNGALTTATAYVAQIMSEHHRKVGAAAPQAHPEQGQHPVGHDADSPRQVDWMRWVWIGLGVLLVFWLIRAIFRGVSGGASYGGPAYGGGYGPGYGGGGGFFSNMLGGLFGAAAGMWMYNNFFGGSHYGSSNWGGGAGGGAVGGATGAGSEPSDVGAGDPYVSGGDYGNDGGGNAGGGNDAAAGGDWNDAGDMGGGGGGGDWGGGGDIGGGGDWGGGGGDWGGGGGGGDW